MPGMALKPKLRRLDTLETGEDADGKKTAKGKGKKKKAAKQ